MTQSIGSKQYTDISDRAGVGVTLDNADLALIFGEDVISKPESEDRFADELRNVVLRSDLAAIDDLIYRVYNGIATTETAPEIARRNLTYVALLLRSGTIGDEWVRTRGHTNSHARSTQTALPEVHEVWHGQGLLYLQKSVGGTVSDAVVVPLTPGAKVVVAPGWASLVANIGDEPLAVGSWRSVDCRTQHDALTARGGMAHFIVSDATATGGYRFEANPGYSDAPEPRVIDAQDRSAFGLKAEEPMLTSFHRNPDFLRFMLRPQDFDSVWSGLYKGDAA